MFAYKLYFFEMIFVYTTLSPNMPTITPLSPIIGQHYNTPFGGYGIPMATVTPTMI